MPWRQSSSTCSSATFEVERRRTNMDPAPVTTNQAPNIQSADVICTHVLRGCAAELGEVFSNHSAQVPTCLRTSTIVPVPKQTAITSLNNYRPLALTPVILKCLERLVLQHIKAALPPTLDPNQYT